MTDLSNDLTAKKTTLLKPMITREESERRRRSVDRARAANIRQGYVHDPVLEDANNRYINGEISLDEFGLEMIKAVQK